MVERRGASGGFVAVEWVCGYTTGVLGYGEIQRKAGGVVA
jgi:hypothetical protein